MSTSGTTTFNMTALKLIGRAFKCLGKGDEGEALSAAMYADGLEVLNLVIKRIGASDHLFSRAEGTVTLVADQAGYIVSPRALRVTSVRRRQDGIDTPLSKMSRDEYFEQPTRTTSSSMPVSYYFDPQTTAGTLYLWPAPSTATVAVPTTLNYTYLRRIEDMISSDDDLDMPQEWASAIIWNTADDLEPQYPVNDARLAAKVTGKAREFLAMAKGWDNEDASIYLQPSYEGMELVR